MNDWFTVVLFHNIKNILVIKSRNYGHLARQFFYYKLTEKYMKKGKGYALFLCFLKQLVHNLEQNHDPQLAKQDGIHSSTRNILSNSLGSVFHLHPN